MADLSLLVTLIIWFGSSAAFNDCTPRLLKEVISTGGDNIDVTLLELMVTVGIGMAMLWCRSQRCLPPRALWVRLLLLGSVHLCGCRLFLAGLQRIPVSLSQTIRASNPIVVVLAGWLVLGERFPAPVVASLAPIIGGFATAVSADAEMDPLGVAAATGSLLCLVAVNHLSKGLLSNAKYAQMQISSGELQCWCCVTALLVLLPLWSIGGGGARAAVVLGTAAAEKGAAWRLASLVALDGALYFTEQAAQTRTIQRLDVLSLAVVDTTRRLWIVCVAGFVLQGNLVTRNAVIGVILVCGGALGYAVTSHRSSRDKRKAE